VIGPPSRTPSAPLVGRTATPVLVLVLAAVVLGACTPSRTVAPTAAAAEATGASLAATSFVGGASWYGPGFAGRRTASGEVFDPSDLTAAHRTLPFGTRVRVTDLETGGTVEVRINDRGPFSPGRVIDLSRAAASALDAVGRGVIDVRVDVLATNGAARLAVAADLRGFEARSSQHRPGQLLLLTSDRAADPVLVRIVAGEAGSGADLFVAPELYLVLGPLASVESD
jgi:rare lipoprotein A (peptidoglycan hydrolase)